MIHKHHLEMEYVEYVRNTNTYSRSDLPKEKVLHHCGSARLPAGHVHSCTRHTSMSEGGGAGPRRPQVAGPFRVLSQHSGADWEAGRTGGPRGEQIEGVEQVDQPPVHRQCKNVFRV